MYWNDRIFRNRQGEYTYYTIQEVYYNENDEIIGYVDAEEGKSPWADSPEEMKTVLEWMLLATERPVIDRDELNAYFEVMQTQPNEGEYEVNVFESVEDLLAELDREDDERPSGD